MQPVAMLRRILVGFLLLTPISSIPIDNGIEGDPEVECGPTALGILLINYLIHLIIKL